MINFKKIKIDKGLLIVLLIIMVVSIIVINSSMLYLSKSLGNLAIKQTVWYLIGLIMTIIIFIMPSDNYNYSYFFYFLNIILLFILLIVGEPINGSKCWFIIPGIGSFQPSEFMKIALILITSKIVGKWTTNLTNTVTFKDEIKILFKIFFILFLPTFLTFLEPDTGAVLIYIIIVLSILWISPLRRRWFIILISIISILITIFFSIYFFKQDVFTDIFGTDLFYRINRLLDWRKGTGMQLENSLTAIGSSGIIGHGYRKTPIYFPESGTDFIFAVFASNFGLIGSIVLLLLLVIFNRILIDIGKKSSRIVNKYIIAGTVGMIIYQQIQNIGMTLGILPITGITLPFISYGGSSLLSYLFIIGIILKISSQNKKTIN